MKKITMVMAFMIATVAVMAQGESFNKFYAKYAENPDFTQVSVSSSMFKLIADLSLNGSEEDKEVMDMVKKLRGFKMIATNDKINGDKYFNEARPLFNKGYDELMTVKNVDDNMVFLVKEQNDKIEELVMLIGGGNKFVAISLFGEIDLKKISKLAKKMNIDGLEHLNNLDDTND